MFDYFPESLKISSTFTNTLYIVCIPSYTERLFKISSVNINVATSNKMNVLCWRNCSVEKS